MKRQIAGAPPWARLASQPRITRRDAFWTLLSLALWVGLAYFRPHTISPVCVNAPQECQAAAVPWYDTPTLGQHDRQANDASLITQNLSGALGAAIPLAWSIGTIATAGASPLAALAAFGTDFVIVLQTAGWNGAATELAHVLSRRPRPYAIGAPGQAANVQAYTSFYSGHTSFVAAMMFSVLFVLLSRGAPGWLLLGWAGFGQAMIMATGAFRVLAGRHFISDVCVAAAAGLWAAAAVAYRHRRGSKA